MIDVFDLGWWPTFKVADICIVLGVAALSIENLAPGTDSPRKE